MWFGRASCGHIGQQQPRRLLGSYDIVFSVRGTQPLCGAQRMLRRSENQAVFDSFLTALPVFAALLQAFVGHGIIHLRSN